MKRREASSVHKVLKFNETHTSKRRARAGRSHESRNTKVSSQTAATVMNCGSQAEERPVLRV